MDLSTELAGIRLRNPLVLASGVLGVTASSMARVAGAGAGAVTTKSIGPRRRMGHKNPTVVELDYGLLNAIGLSCPDPAEAIDALKETIKQVDVPVIASFFAGTVSEFGYMAELLSGAKPDFLEANISCPNVEDSLGKPFGCSHQMAAKVTRAVKNSCKIPLIVKLTPNVVDIKVIAGAVEEAGADVISAINTVGPGMKIDVKGGKPVLSNRVGGLSGPAIKPIAVRCVYDICGVVDVPVIGVGGVECAEDAVELLMAGASAVGVGTAVWRHGVEVFGAISTQIQEFMKEEGYSNLGEIIGKAHE